MAKSSEARRISRIGEGPKSDQEVSGIRSRRALRSSAVERQTAKVPKVDLERLLAEERELADFEEVDDTMIVAPDASSSDVPPSQETTLRLQAPSIPDGVPSPLGSDFPPPIAELTEVMKNTPVSIPAPAPVPTFESMRVERDEARRTKRLVVAIWAFALTVAGSLGYVVATHG